MTNFEHMTDEEKKLAIMYGLYITRDGEIKVCHEVNCKECKDNPECRCSTVKREREAWLDAEYVAPKTKNEKFCETLKAGEVIAVSDADENLTTNFTYLCFDKYDKEKDLIRTGGFYNWSWKHGRKLTAEERGE